ncbi:hypothetical protein, partial [Xanthomonas nasturtii]
MNGRADLVYCQAFKTGMATMQPTALYPRLQALQAIASRIYGTRWQHPMARALSVPLSTLAGWVQHETVMPASYVSVLEPVHNLLSNSAKKAKWMNCRLVLS